MVTLLNSYIFVTFLKQVDQDVAFFSVQVWRQVRMHLWEDESVQTCGHKSALSIQEHTCNYKSQQWPLSEGSGRYEPATMETGSTYLDLERKSSQAGRSSCLHQQLDFKDCSDSWG